MTLHQRYFSGEPAQVYQAVQDLGQDALLPEWAKKGKPQPSMK